MLLGVMNWMEQENDRVMQITAWQTALLMTASGNYKKGVKPDKLYEPLESRKKKSKKKNNDVDIESQRQELKNLFGIQEGSSKG